MNGALAPSGILDFIKTPEGQGLLSAAFAGMAGARRGQPWNTAGAAGLGGLLGYTRAQENQQQAGLRDLQMKRYTREDQEYEKKLALENARKDILGTLGSLKNGAPTIENEQNPQYIGPQDIYSRLMAGGDLEGALAFMNSQPKMGAPQTVSQGGRPVLAQSDPWGGFKPVQGFDPYEKELDPRIRGAKIDDAVAEQDALMPGKIKIAGAGRAPGGYGDFYPTDTGYHYGDKRAGTMTPVLLDGKRVVKSSDSPGVREAVKRAENRGGEIGKGEGEMVVSIPGKEAALDSVRTARKTLQEGINAGLYSTPNQLLDKGAPLIGNKERAARTEEFKSYIGNTVIPRLKEFGGNDSNEEMRYLQGVMGGDITMEPKALEKILADSERKIQAGIDRAKGVQAKPPGATVNSGTDLGGGFRVK